MSDWLHRFLFGPKREQRHPLPMAGGTRDPETYRRFWSRVGFRMGTDPKMCWQWLAIGSRRTPGKYATPYGRFKLDGHTVGAHKASYVLFRGEIPAGMQVLHTCDNPACVRPSHLFLGTQQDNVADAVAKGRMGPPGRESRLRKYLRETGNLHSIGATTAHPGSGHE